MRSIMISEPRWVSNRHLITNIITQRATVGLYRLIAESDGVWNVWIMKPEGGVQWVLGGTAEIDETLDDNACTQRAKNSLWKAFADHLNPREGSNQH